MPDIASNSIDAAMIAAVSAALGPQRMHELVLLLADRVSHLAAAAELFPEAAETCLAALHQSRGSAASLGFPALAEGLARMEAVARQALRHTGAGGYEFEAVRHAGRALPGLLKDAMQATLPLPPCAGGTETESKKDLLFL